MDPRRKPIRRIPRGPQLIKIGKMQVIAGLAIEATSVLASLPSDQRVIFRIAGGITLIAGIVAILLGRRRN